jgi:Sec-independent protein translocase protein TatA
MELFGIGPLELLLILLLALIIFGPKDIEKTARSLGRSLYKLINSETWRTLTQASRKLKNIPDDLIREARLEDLEAKKASGQIPSTAWLDDPHINPPGLPPVSGQPAGRSAGAADGPAGAPPQESPAEDDSSKPDQPPQE